MTDNPFHTLLIEALNLLHPRFAASSSASFLFEFYHQIRHLWDRAVPVQLGLGHVLIQADTDLHFQQLGERGAADAKLGVVAVAMLSDASALDDALVRLARFRKQDYPNAVCVIAGRRNEIPASGLPEAPGVSVLFFDVERWQVSVEET